MHILSKGADPFRMSLAGALLGAIAFAIIIMAAPLGTAAVFKTGVFFLGAGGGLFSHGTLTATMNAAPKDQAGLALGAWGQFKPRQVASAPASRWAASSAISLQLRACAPPGAPRAATIPFT